ncbi:hypothetical protein [Paraburkholderia sp.]|uniref:hypothetical protein n=1 Tax=Paraburkholderia sp. TaxID=1926495 RepID=UPI002D340778|nr:hypothetical protein [Paraburkholderia sp.]HZZ05641.1 hypothetical protein [Paraburkholderia sp.]
MNAAEFLKTLRTLRRSHAAARKRGGNLTPAQVVSRWNGAYANGTLANWRQAKHGSEGLKFVKVAGRVLYPLDKLVDFEVVTLAIIERKGAR